MRGITVAIIFLLGFVAGGILLPRLVHPTKENSENVWKEKFQQLTDSEVTEYYKLKTMEEKYKKADEIMGKIMTIFLTDLGIRVSKATLDLSKEPLPMSHYNESNKILNSLQIKPPHPLFEKPKKNWLSAERRLGDIRNRREVSTFLEEVKIDDLDSKLKMSSRFTNHSNILDYLRGEFSGFTAFAERGERHYWRIKFSINAEMRDGLLMGTTSVEIREKNTVVSVSNEDGEIKLVRDFGSGSRALLIKASPTTYLQLYYLRDLDELAGHIYKRGSEKEPFIQICTIRLEHH